jgi:molecular chaperone DnaJ
MAATARDLYDVLGVSATADREQIRTAFRRLAREHHPDVSNAPEADERFREVVEAYRTLSRPTARRMYDMFGRHGLGADAVDELARWLGGRRPPAKPEVVGALVLEFGQAARGGTYAVDVEAEWTCSACTGCGAEPGSVIERCESCAGSGRLRRSTNIGDGRLLQIESCPGCDGSGRRVPRPCAACGGEGRVSATRTVAVDVPAGATDGDTVALPVEDEAAVIAINVRSLPDARLVRYAATALLVAALAFLGVLLLP